MKVGKIKVTNKGSGSIKSEGKVYPIPKVFAIAKDEHHGKICEFQLNEKGTAVKLIVIDGKKVGINEDIQKAAQEKAKRKELRVIAENELKEKKKNLEKDLKGDLFNASNFLGPKDTILPDDVNIELENYGLKIQKFAHYENKKETFSIASGHKKGIDYLKPNFYETNKIDFSKKHISILKKCFGDNLVTFKLTLDARMAIGLGMASVYETSLLLHPIYGIPYIASSGIKGAVRSYLITKYFEGENLEAEAFKATDKANAFQKTMCDIFGAPESIQYKTGQKDNNGNDIKKSKKTYYNKAIRGDISFFDAYPMEVKNEMIEVDVMTPHFGDYYQKKSPPLDTNDPVPVTYLTVAKTTFEFAIAYTPKKNSNSDISLLNKTKEYLIETLKTNGIGAKTALGYGTFK